MNTIPTDTALRDMFDAIKATAAEYPVDLLAARRAAFQAQIEANDPDAVDVDTPPVSDEADERNSRPYPF